MTTIAAQIKHRKQWLIGLSNRPSVDTNSTMLLQCYNSEILYFRQNEISYAKYITKIETQCQNGGTVYS